MELIINFLYEYKKAIITLLVGVVVFLLRKVLGEVLTPELITAIELIIAGLFGRFIRMTKSEAEQLKVLNDPY